MNNPDEKIKQDLSAFIDNEVGPEALSQVGAADPLLHRYQLIGEAIRGQVSDAAMVDVSAQVKLAIENEPAHGVAQQQSSTKTVNSRSWFDISVWMRPLGGMAVAASVAIVMVMVVNQPDSEGVGSAGAGGQIANIEAVPVVSLPVNNVSTNNIDNKKDDESEQELENIKNRAAQDYLQR